MVLPPDTIQALVRQYNVALEYSDRRIRRKVFRALKNQSTSPRTRKEVFKPPPPTSTYSNAMISRRGGQENVRPGVVRVTNRYDGNQRQMNDILMR